MGCSGHCGTHLGQGPWGPVSWDWGGGTGNLRLTPSDPMIQGHLKPGVLVSPPSCRPLSWGFLQCDIGQPAGSPGSGEASLWAQWGPIPVPVRRPPEGLGGSEESMASRQPLMAAVRQGSLKCMVVPSSPAEWALGTGQYQSGQNWDLAGFFSCSFFSEDQLRGVSRVPNHVCPQWMIFRGRQGAAGRCQGVLEQDSASGRMALGRPRSPGRTLT